MTSVWSRDRDTGDTSEPFVATGLISPAHPCIAYPRHSANVILMSYNKHKTM